MNTYADNTKEDKNQTIANCLPKKLQSSDEPASVFANNRPEAIAQRKLQEAVDNSPRVQQLKSYQALADNFTSQITQRKENNTGLPDNLKSGVENLSGYSMDDVKVHYNSDRAAQLQAYAFAQGTDIHLSSGQERHLPHEAWHVVQQKQNRVKPTVQMKDNTNINDDPGLENEADIMGVKALQNIGIVQRKQTGTLSGSTVIQLTGPLIRLNEEHTDEDANTLSELNADPEEEFYRASLADIDFIWDQLLAIDPADLGAADKNHLAELKVKVQNAYDVRVDNSEKVDGYLHTATTGWAEEYGAEPGAGDSLHDFVYNAVVGAVADQNEVSGMRYDTTFGYLPQTQLAYCLTECVSSSEEVLALCLYTSYLYGPLNKYFREQDEPEDTAFGRLIVKTAGILQQAYAEAPATAIVGRRYRLELTSGWIDDDQENIDFAALTSIHPNNIAGVNNMWADIVADKFGPYDNLALLLFEGTAKLKRPAKKYFPGETEDLMGPGANYKVIDSYTINGVITGIGEQAIRVFHLSNVPDAEYAEAENRITFAAESRLTG
ncbi:eCIS core domain-containing protein [Pedobacter sp. NJ-S-72]